MDRTICNFLVYSILINLKFFLLFLIHTQHKNTLKPEPEISRYCLFIWIRILKYPILFSKHFKSKVGSQLA